MISRYRSMRLEGKGGLLKNINNYVSLNNYGTYSI